MPLYHKLGKIPPKRHTIFRKKDGSLHYEQLFGTIGFDGMSSLMYHLYRPTMVKEIGKTQDISPKAAVVHNIKSRLLKGFEIRPITDFLESRKVVLFNSDVHISLAAPQESMIDYFYKNADADELLFIHHGSGTLKTMFGEINFEAGDYLLVPRGTIYQIIFDTGDNRLFLLESYHPIYTPKRYRNWFGQHLEHSPYCERDFKLPGNLRTYDEKGDFILKIKKQGRLHHLVYDSHPIVSVVWDVYT